MKSEKIITYDSVWGVRKVFYHIERYRLPIPISLSELIVFLCLELIFFYLSHHSIWVQEIPWAIKYLIIPTICAGIVNRLYVEGRTPYLYLFSLCSHAISHKQWSKGIPIYEKEREGTRWMTQVKRGE